MFRLFLDATKRASGQCDGPCRALVHHRAQHSSQTLMADVLKRFSGSNSSSKQSTIRTAELPSFAIGLLHRTPWRVSSLADEELLSISFSIFTIVKERDKDHGQEVNGLSVSFGRNQNTRDFKLNSSEPLFDRTLFAVRKQFVSRTAISLECEIGA